jgi:hypothetical protein
MPAANAVIANGATTSNAVFIGSGPLLPTGIRIPALTTSTAVKFTVAVRDTDTFVPLYDATGTEVSVAASTSVARAAPLDPATFSGWPWIKCVVANAQSGAKTLTIVME